jgi:predicted alpha/beta-hydrolase family hydrolase
MPSELKISVGTDAETTAFVYAGQPGADSALILAHGAGAGPQSPFMVDFARGIARHGVHVVTFNFLYVEQHRRIPDRLPLLQGCYQAVVEAVRGHLADAGRRLFIGGKSMGGRIATHLAASERSLSLNGLVLLGYPLHPPGRPDRKRDEHLPAVARPMLFMQGSRDTFGSPGELQPVLARLSPPPTLHVVEGGDHSFHLPRRNPHAQSSLHLELQRTIVDWMQAQP